MTTDQDNVDRSAAALRIMQRVYRWLFVMMAIAMFLRILTFIF